MNLRTLHSQTRSKRSETGSLKKAFTIIELIVVIAIFSVIMAVALWNQKELNNNVLVTNLAYEVALAVRETQAYGIGVRAQPGADNTVDFQGGFGLYIDINNPQQLILFKDVDDNKSYDIGTETFATYNFQNQNGNKIVALCSAHIPGPSHPCIAGGDTSKNQMTILFKRPNPEASFIVSGATPISKGPGVIVVNTPAGNNCRAIIIEATGQIHVENALSTYPACVNTSN